MKNSTWFVLFATIIVVVVVVGLAVFLPALSDCTAKGGQLVRAVFGYACVVTK